MSNFFGLLKLNFSVYTEPNYIKFIPKEHTRQDLDDGVDYIYWGVLVFL